MENAASEGQGLYQLERGLLDGLLTMGRGLVEMDVALQGTAIWVRRFRDRMLSILRGEAASVIRGLRRMGTEHGLTADRKKTLRTICGYLENNRDRMHYDEYLAAGYPIATGVIEGACRHLVKDRMERSGMRWTLAGVRAMLHLRAIHINDDWHAYQTFRIAAEQKTIHPLRSLVPNTYNPALHA